MEFPDLRLMQIGVWGLDYVITRNATLSPESHFRQSPQPSCFPWGHSLILSPGVEGWREKCSRTVCTSLGSLSDLLLWSCGENKGRRYPYDVLLLIGHRGSSLNNGAIDKGFARRTSTVNENCHCWVRIISRNGLLPYVALGDCDSVELLALTLAVIRNRTPS